MEKPWENGGLADPSPVDRPKTPPMRVALRFFLVVVGILFFMMVVAYAGRLSYEDWRPVPSSGLMWLNTAILVAASIAMQVSVWAARANNWRRSKLALEIGGLLTVAFLFAQVWAWRQLVGIEMFEIHNPAIALFLIITGAHGLHMLGGLWVWLRTTNKIWRSNDFDTAKVRQSIELSTTYWHFLLAVWLVLFGLLFVNNDNLDILLTICGLK